MQGVKVMVTAGLLLLYTSAGNAATLSGRSSSAHRDHLISKRDAEAEPKASATAEADANPTADATAEASANAEAATFGVHHPHQVPPHPHHAFIPSHGPPLHGGHPHPGGAHLSAIAPHPGVPFGHPLPPFDPHAGGPGVARVRSRGLGYDFTYDIGGHHPIHRGTHLTHKHKHRVIHHKVKDDHHDDHGDEYYEDDDEKYDENHIISGYGLNRVRIHSHGDDAFHGRGLSGVTHTSIITSRPVLLGGHVPHGGLGHLGAGPIVGHGSLVHGIGHAGGHGIGHAVHGPHGLSHGLGPAVPGHSLFGRPHLGHPGGHGGHSGFILNSHPGPGLIGHHGGGLGHGGFNQGRGLVPHSAGAFFSGHNGHGAPLGGVVGGVHPGVTAHAPHGHAGVPVNIGKQISHDGYYGGGTTHAVASHQ